MKIHSQESGRSMVEMLGVLAIIGVLSVGGIAGYSQAMNKFKVTKTTDQIQTMITNIRTLTASQRNVKMIDDKKLMYSLGALTDEMCVDTTCSTLVNPYGGQIKVASYGQGNKRFYISYDALPSSACINLATQAWGDAASGLDAIVTGTGTPTAASAAPTTSTTSGTMSTADKGGAAGMPMSLTSAGEGCAQNVANAYIIWYLR